MTQHPARTPQDMPTRDEVLALSGLAFIEAIRDGKLAGPPIGSTTLTPDRTISWMLVLISQPL